jgi:uncharacterized membrane protein
MAMDGHFNLLIFILGSMLFFVLPLSIIIGIINFLISKRMAKKEQQKSKYYWTKLVSISILILLIGLFLYEGYYSTPQY